MRSFPRPISCSTPIHRWAGLQRRSAISNPRRLRRIPPSPTGYFHFPIVYIEYSGTYGDPAVVKAASEAIDQSILYYGGGINSAEKAALMGKFADTIVVGNAVYDQGAAVLKATVDAVQ